MPESLRATPEEQRVLLVAPTGKDGALAQQVLGTYDLDVHLCASLPALCEEAQRGVGVIMIAEESLNTAGMAMFEKFLADQPAWSDPPIIFLTSRFSASVPQQHLRIFNHSGNVNILERPLHGLGLVSSVQVALRARLRQYQVRNLLDERETVLASINDSFAMVDHDWRFIFANRRASEMYGAPVEELIGKNKWEVIGDAVDDNYRRHMEIAATEKREVSIEFFHPVTRRWYEKRFYPSDGGTAIFATDITERKEAEDQLKALNLTLEKRVAERTAVAEQKNRQLRALASELTEIEQRERRRLAHILHDSIQQLLVATKLRVSMLQSRATEPENREALHEIDELIGRSIDESRSLTVELSPPILYEGGLGNAIQWLSRRMENDHHLRIELDCDDEIAPASDDMKAFLFEAVREFLFNVIKHSGAKEAAVTLKAAAPGLGVLTVRDSGDGFDPSQQSSQQGGFGLFSIRERLELYGGRIAIDSAPGKGATISLFFPVQIEEDSRQPSTTCAGDDSSDEALTEGEKALSRPNVIRVLLVDDHQMVRAGLATLLKAQSDIEVISEASDGLMAIKEARSAKPDVIIMDVNLPHLNGVEATRLIRSEFPHVKIIGLSMHEEEDMAQNMRNAGACAYITKGAASETLAATIRSCCGRNSTDCLPAAAG